MWSDSGLLSRSMQCYLEPREATEQVKHHCIIGLFKPDAFQLSHGGLQERVDLHHCHGVFEAIRCLFVLQCTADPLNVTLRQSPGCVRSFRRANLVNKAYDCWEELTLIHVPIKWSYVCEA